MDTPKRLPGRVLALFDVAFVEFVMITSVVVISADPSAHISAVPKASTALPTQTVPCLTMAH